MINFSRPQHIISQIILIVVILANMYWFKLPAVGLIFGFFYLWLNSKKISDIFAEKIHRNLRDVMGLVTILTYISIIYTISYHIYQINDWIFIFTLVSLPIIIEILSWRLTAKHYFFNNINFEVLKIQNIRRSFLPTAVFFLDLLLFVVLYKKASVGIIRSPWELVSYKFWLVFLISNILLVTNLIYKKAYKNIILISWHFLLLSTIAVILYPLGYGYDSFIHHAALKNIASTGTIEPRLFFYIGQYGLTFFSSNIFQISLATANKFLLPILFSLLWPSTLFYGLKYGFSWSYKSSYLATLWSLFIGFGFAVMTTPQSFTYLLAAIFIFLLPEINKKRITLFFAWMISIMTLTIHPLVGIPILSFTTLIFIWRRPKNLLWHRIIKPLTYFFSCIALPALFAVYQYISGIAWHDIFHFKVWPLIHIPNLYWNSSYSFPLDMLYNLEENKFWLYALVVLVGIYLIIRENKWLFFKRLVIFTAILIINYLVTTVFLSFNLQIDYQKNDYINRISYLIILFLLPIFITAIYFIFNRINKINFSNKLFLGVVTVILVIVGTYFSYPVYDKHGNSKSFNVTDTDLKTVEIIEKNAEGKDYIVLANQMVGVAAIETYGFAHYYNDNFYYSMPLGNANIYENYLQMIEVDASRDEVLKAMDKAGVDKLYFVVNNYWHSAKLAISQAENNADSRILVDEGVNTVFVYNR